jgi:hypothetical protein
MSEPYPRLRASDLGRYVYCAHAWWLERVQGVAPENLAALETGLQRHAEHGRRARAATHQAAWARALLLAALALGAGLLFSFWRG